MADGSTSSSESTNACSGGGTRREIMLFGVRVVLDPMRKCVSLNNLSEYEQTAETPKIDGEDRDGQDMNKPPAGYASADEALPISSSNVNRERKRGTLRLKLFFDLSINLITLIFPSLVRDLLVGFLKIWFMKWTVNRTIC